MDFTYGVWSLPARERGLKPAEYNVYENHAFVAPRAGAWIETGSADQFQASVQSLPARERGLKLVFLYD